jgi:hypothetical protein
MKNFPLPEAIDGNEWAISEGSGSIDTVNRLMLVPLGVDDAAQHVRCHEMAHAKITPKHAAHKQAEKYRISMSALQVCEDLRVHRFLSHSKVETSGAVSQEECDRLVERTASSVRELALLFVASLHTPDYARVLASAKRVAPESVVNAIERGVGIINRRMSQARNLFRPIGFRNATAPCARLFDALFPENGHTPADDAIPLADLLVAGRKTRATAWGELKVVSPALSEMRSVAPLSRRSAYSDEGTFLKAPYRLPLDGRVFRQYRAAKGGTVLVDISGSMNLTHQDVRQIVAAAPAATVSVYCGSGTSGQLTVVARKGRVVDSHTLAKARIGNGNIVDGPALQWLAKQPEPRLWISDGYVTGKHDTTSVDLGAEAQVICNRANISRIKRVAPKEIVAALGRR